MCTPVFSNLCDLDMHLHLYVFRPRRLQSVRKRAPYKFVTASGMEGIIPNAEQKEFHDGCSG